MKRALADFGPLSPAERKLRDEICNGEGVILGDGSCPGERAGPDRHVRADFLRYLILGGCKALPGKIPENGVRIEGALVKDKLDLCGARIGRDVGLIGCRFDTTPDLMFSHLGNLNLSRSAIPGLKADGLRLDGTLYLTDLQSVGEIRLVGAKISAILGCDGARLRAGDGRKALNVSGADVNGGFFLRFDAQIEGVLDLTSSRFRSINDDKKCWPTAGNLLLNRCQYGAFSGGPVDAASRIRWLDLQDPAKYGENFWPQPWEHCATVLREMGHTDDARQVLIAKEKRQRADRRRKLRSALLFEDAYWAGFWDFFLGVTVRYGRQPLLAFAWLLGFWLAGAAIFQSAAAHDAIKPNNVFVLRSAEWAACHPAYDPPVNGPPIRWDAGAYSSQLECFLDQPEAAGYPRFNALVYSADTLLPIVAMEMQEFWIPDEAQGPRGAATRVFLWVQIAMGWALSLLAVAGFSGLVKSD